MISKPVSLATSFLAATLAAGCATPYPPNTPCEMALPPEDPRAGPRDDGTYSVMSLNIKDVPAFYKGDVVPMLFPQVPIDDPVEVPHMPQRGPCISKLADRYDIVAFQEAFHYAAAHIERSTSHPWYSAPAFSRDPVARFFNPLAGRPGLAILSRHPKRMTESVSGPYGFCNGFISEGADCMADKGYQAVRFGTMEIVNTHLDSGRAEADRKVRALQLELLARNLPRGPLMVLGDFNIDSHANDVAAMDRFLKKTGLSVALHHEVDYILTRDVEVTEAGVLPSCRLSDHDALTARFRMPPRAP